jgi:cell division protease FtsH
VAEEIVFGDVSTGAENDLDRATAMARHMAGRCGMSERLGLATFNSNTMPPSAHGMRYSERTAQLVAEEVHKLLNEAHDRVMQTLRERRAPLERVAQRLLEREVLDHEALLQLIEEPAPAPGKPAERSDGKAIASI